MKKNFSAVLLVLLLLSLIMNVVQYVAHKQPPKSLPVGTYCTSEGTPLEGEYYVFQEDYVFVKYRQYEFIEEGVYSHIFYEGNDYGLFSLESNAQDRTAQVLIQDRKLFEFCDDGKIHVYTKISDTPTFVNIDI